MIPLYGTFVALNMKLFIIDSEWHYIECPFFFFKSHRRYDLGKGCNVCNARLYWTMLTFRVRPVASAVQNGLFPYLLQMINSIRGYVACDDPWPWPISRSFGLDLKNRVPSVASPVLNGFFLYLAQMITIISRCVACYLFFRIWKFKFLAIFYIFFDLDLENKSTVLDGFFPYLAQMITSIRGCVVYNDLWSWPISLRSFGLGLENRIRSLASTVLDGFFPYLVQMITSMRRYVACDDLWLLTYIFKVIRPWLWKSCPLCNVFSSRSIISIFATNNHYY